MPHDTSQDSSHNNPHNNSHKDKPSPTIAGTAAASNTNRKRRQGVDIGALPSDGQQTSSQPEPQRESAAAQHEKPATGITPSGSAGGRRM